MLLFFQRCWWTLSVLIWDGNLKWPKVQLIQSDSWEKKRPSLLYTWLGRSQWNLWTEARCCRIFDKCSSICKVCYSDKISLWWRGNLPISGHSVLHKTEPLYVSGTDVKGVCVSNSFSALLTRGRLLPIQPCKVFD